MNEPVKIDAAGNETESQSRQYAYGTDPETLREIQELCQQFLEPVPRESAADGRWWMDDFHDPVLVPYRGKYVHHHCRIPFGG